MDDAHPKMRFSLSPPPPKAVASAATSPTYLQARANDQRTSGSGAEEASAASNLADDAASDYIQWLHAMKLVARLPGGMPPEFRRKLWLSLADKYLKSKNVDWAKEEEKCFCEKWREDDEELGIQIVKDLHRTGSNLCTGPAGSINQAKLKRILLGYARYNPAVGYCQGFNMLGALILQVMDKEESESMKVMIYLVEGVLPTGYFCGSMGGLQADMGVFRDLMQTKLPRLAKHLQKLQGPVENAFEPPLTNVFTMQWFLTMFCTCLPMTCVLRVWDLVLIEGSDVLLRTALVLWSLLEERVLNARTADDFYCKMGSFSSELLNGHLIDSNGLIEKVVQLGPIPDIQKLRDKHLYNIAPLRHKQGLQLYFDDEEPESDEESRLAVATVWGLPWGRRGSQGQSTTTATKHTPENKDRIALDISLLKKQYDRLRERQKQAHIILTTACSTARQVPTANQLVPVNQLLLGRSAIVTNKGRRVGPPPGAIPPARKPSLPTVLQTKPPEKQLRRGETLHWRDTDLTKRRRDSLTWKEIKADRAISLVRQESEVVQPIKLRSRMGKSDSSSYSEESDGEGSSTDTSLCDEDDPASTGDKTRSSSIENSPKRRSKSGRKQKDLPSKLQNLAVSRDSSKERKRPKSWAPSTHEIPFMLMTSDSPVHSGDEQPAPAPTQPFNDSLKEEEDSATESDRVGYKRVKDLNWSVTKYSPIAGDLATTAKLGALHVQTDVLLMPTITSTSQLSPMPDISTYLNNSTISPLPTPKPLFLDSTNSLGSGDGDDAKKFDVNDDGVTNQYFERVNSVERPNKLELFYSLNEEDGIRNDEIGEDGELKSNVEHKIDASEPSYKTEFIFKPDTDGKEEELEPQIIVKIATSLDEKDDPGLNRRMELLMDYSEKSSAAYIAEATSELSTTFKKDKLRNEEERRLELEMACHERDNNIPGENRDDFKESTSKSTDADSFEIKTVQLNRKHSLNNASKKRRDPRRLTLTRSTTIDIEERFQDFERRLSVEMSTKEASNLKEPDGQENCSNNEVQKAIPSTEDLEKRFHTLEKQLSASKARPPSISEDIRNDDDEIITRSNMKTEIPDSDTDTDPPSKTGRARIPSTADLESRYNALEKQMSSNSLTAKNSVDLKGSEKDESANGKTNKSNSKESGEKEAEMEESQTSTKSESVDKPKDTTEESEKPRLTKLPSTAELEDRFNVLERKKSIQKSSPPKSKKEPPDGQESEEQENVKTENKTVNVKSSEKSETSDPEKLTEIKKPEVQRDTKSESGSSEAERPRLTKLPSTAELEDRFNELERKKSLQKSSPTKIKKVEKEASDNDENKAESAEGGRNGGTPTSNGNTRKVVEEVKREPEETKSTENNKVTPEKNKAIDTEEESVKKETKKVVETMENAQKSEEFVATNDEALVEGSTKPIKPKSSTPTRKKAPPSTEELEKRFNALEKQLSTTSLESAGGKEKPPTQKMSQEKEKETETKEVSTVGNKATEPKKTEEQSKKSMKSFEDKCSSINKEINEESDRKEQEVKSTAEVKQLKSMQAFSEKCKSINEQLVKEDERIEAEKAESLAQELEKRKEERSMSKRRASEPPTTEDLEKRYESLKRRMSSKIVTEKPQLTKSETVDEALERIEKEVTEETIEVAEPNEMSTEPKKEKSSSESPKQPEAAGKKKSSEPPSTEDLESRYEALQRSSSRKPEKQLSIKSKELEDEEVPVSRKIVETVETVDASPKEHPHNIPDAPPMPLAEKSIMADKTSPSQRRALIEEFQSKIKSQPNDENLKPSDINPNRKRPPEQRASPKVDETSEAHADTAFYRSGNYEPWLTQPNRMVRRFSDLPSRSDLENRLQFLEKQLSKKFYKQRCASDSEVASRRHFVGVQNLYADDDIPSTSQRQQQSSGDLENRVQALEKQLSENSLKLLEAMRVKMPDVVAESESPRRLSSETLDGTGKELVKYTHFGELEETESHKPINISINIKMLLNKDGSVDRKRKTESLPTTEELEKRLEILEEQIRASKARHSESVDKEGEQKSKPKSELNVDLNSSEVKNVQAEKELQSDAGEKVRKDIVNEDVKCEAKESEMKVELQIVNDDIKCEDVPEENITKMKTETKKEVTKAEKTIENQEIARSQKSMADDKVPEKKVEAKEKEKEVQEKKMESSVEENKVEPEAKAKKMDSEDVETRMEPEKNEMKESNKDNQKQHPNEHESQLANTNPVSIEKPEAKSSKNEKVAEKPVSNQLPDNVVINATDGLGPVDPNNKTMVLLLDNEPKAVKVRRLTRANTEELEGLFQALEKQLSDRNLVKTEDGKLKRADSKPETENKKPSHESKAISDLTKEIEEFTSGEKIAKKPKEEEYDWGIDPIKRHLKRKTVHLPSTKELESRFRSLERQIKLLEDVENIDVEQRLNEIERKIKLQYSLSTEQDLNKYLELCEGRGLDDIPDIMPTAKSRNSSPHNSPARSRAKSPYTSPSRVKERTPHTSPSRTQDHRSPYTSPSRSTRRSPYTSPTHTQNIRSPYTSPSRSSKRSPGASPYEEDSSIPSTEDLEYRYRALNLTRSKSKESLDGKSKRKVEPKKQPIHPLEMLLDPSPDDSDIPSTGELEHRMRIMDEKRRSPSPSPPPQRRSRNRSPTIDDMKRQKMLDQQRPRKPIHNLETLVVSPTRRELPTADELDARMRALEDDHSFDFKMQKNYKEFNQKLKDAISPSLSFEEFTAQRSREGSPRRSDYHRPTTPKSALRDRESESRRDECRYRSTSPKVIRFRDNEEYRPKSWTGQHDTERMVGNADGVLHIIEENSKMLHRILKKTLADSSSNLSGVGSSFSEGLDELGTRLMRETSPITRTGTHTGIPLRTDDNINDRLNSIKNTIKSIDTLCEEKPYHKEKCQRYIDSLCSGSVHFANPPSKKTSLEDLTRSESRSRREYTPSIRVSDHSQRPSEYFLSRSVGSAESIHTSPLRAASPLHRSNRDIRRDISPRRRRDEEREEYESRVRRENMLPNYIHDNHSALSSGSLTKFHKVDSQLDTYKYDERERSSSRSASRSPLRSPYGSREMTMMLPAPPPPHHNHNTTANTFTTTATNSNRFDLDRPVSPYRQTSHNLLGYDSLNRSTTPVYAPAKLDIRHTTVTSTFYDRLLTEKHIEKTLSRPPSRSPVVSPSVTSKSYLDIPVASGGTNNAKSSNENSPTTPRVSSIVGGTTGFGNEGNYTSMPSYASSTYNATTPLPLQYSATTPTGNCSTPYQTALLTRLPPLAATDASSHIDLRIRSCDNILMQLKSTSYATTAGAGSAEATPPLTANSSSLLPTVIDTTSINATTSSIATTTASYISTNLYNPSAINSFSSNIITTTNTTTSSSSSNIFNTSLYSTGVYNPLMPLTMGQPSYDMGISLGQYTSTLNNNTPSASQINSATELPKF